MHRVEKQKTLLLVDDEATNLQVLRHTLQDNYRLLFAKEGKTALELARAEQPDLILLDIMMPEISGYEVCTQLKAQDETSFIPVIFITALSDSADEEKGFDLGAVDYIIKPFSPSVVKARVRTHLSLVHAEEVLDTRLKIIQSLGRAAEYRDNETGMHVVRISHHAKRLALQAGYSEDAAQELFNAAPMHDVGKIGITDSILLKPGSFEPDEWAIMRKHTEIGAQIIGDHRSPLLQLAATLARSHHEKYNGKGYPQGLKGEEIPHQVRILSLVDVFDALLSTRPYKQPWPLSDALALIKKERGEHFDPELVDLFLADIAAHLDIQKQFADNQPLVK